MSADRPKTIVMFVKVSGWVQIVVFTNILQEHAGHNVIPHVNCPNNIRCTIQSVVILIFSILCSQVFSSALLACQNISFTNSMLLVFCEIFLCCSIHDHNTEYAAYKEVKMFYEALQQQMIRVVQFNVASGQLVRIKTPALTITSETKLRAQTGGILNNVLMFLYEGSVKIDTCTPTLGVRLF
jgi:hypothetical protein